MNKINPAGLPKDTRVDLTDVINTTNPIIIGIRHHSPACAKLVETLINKIRPKYVLIEGPMNFNDRLNELYLNHELPIAIYTYSVEKDTVDSFRNGAWYPFAEHSPEWQALQSGKLVNANVKFIDIPSSYMSISSDESEALLLDEVKDHDWEIEFDEVLCKKLGVTNTDTLWDQLFEDDLSFEDLQQSLNAYFKILRGDKTGSQENQLREHMMARWINWAISQKNGPVLVVCGGYHAPALDRLWSSLPIENEEPLLPQVKESIIHDAYLVPYSYKRLDALAGYSAGMPASQYQQWVFELGVNKAGLMLVETIFSKLRTLKIPASTADMKAVFLSAQALSQVRGHKNILRNDWLDAITSALIKDYLEVPLPWSYRGPLMAHTNPIIVNMLDVLAGKDINGKLSKRTPAPALVNEIMDFIDSLTDNFPADIKLDLLLDKDKITNQRLYQITILGIPDIKKINPRTNAILTEFTELWSINKSINQQAALIEASIYGGTLLEAACAKLAEQVQKISTSSINPIIELSQLLTLSIFAGITHFTNQLLLDLQSAVLKESNFEDLGEVLKIIHAIYKQNHKYDNPENPIIVTIITAIFDRILWLCESYGSVNTNIADKHILTFKSITLFLKDLLATADEAGEIIFNDIEISRAISVFERKTNANIADPISRGAALGALISLSHYQTYTANVTPLSLLQEMPPYKLGDVLSGLLALAIDEMLLQSDFFKGLNHIITQLSDDDFIISLPSIRNAFYWLPPKERAEIASIVLSMNDANHLSSKTLTSPKFTDDVVDIAKNQKYEKEAIHTLEKWGINYHD